MKKAMRMAMLALLSAGLVLGGACAKKPVPQAKADDKFLAEARAAQAKRDAWMTQGVYVAGKTEWQNKIIQAAEKSETLANYQVGLYNDTHVQALEFDGETKQGDFHFRFNRNHQEVPVEFYILEDRYYSQEGDSLLDNGPKSRSQGEKLFLPLLQDIRAAVKQAARGEIKDVGPAVFQQIPVHKYDLKIGLPGDPPELLTATVEIDEARGLLLHAVVGNGVGTESAEKRFQKSYREAAFTKIGGIASIALPAGVPVTPYQEDINKEKLGAP